MRDTAYRVLQVRDRLLAENQREPSVEQIAKELDLPREEVVFAMDAIVDPVSLYEPGVLRQRRRCLRHGSGPGHEEH